MEEKDGWMITSARLAMIPRQSAERKNLDRLVGDIRDVVPDEVVRRELDETAIEDSPLSQILGWGYLYRYHGDADFGLELDHAQQAAEIMASSGLDQESWGPEMFQRLFRADPEPTES
jgi:hypothetical protein